MLKPLVIIGSGGNAADILDIVDALNGSNRTWDVVGLLDDNAPLGETKYGRTIIGRLADAERFPEAWFINSIGSERSFRERDCILNKIGIPDARFTTLVHPRASISHGAELGAGSYACFGVSVGQGARVGQHVHLGVGAILGHDCQVGDCTLVAAGALISGFTKVGRGSYVGAGASVKQGIRVGDGALIGMGAVVVHDVQPGMIVMGNPALPRVVRYP